jgi:hypothetical protein
MRIQSLLLAACVMGLAPVAASADPANQAASPSATVQPASEQVVCNYYYHEGTVIRRPFCMTQAEVVRRRLDTQHLIQEYQRKSFTMN